MSPRPSISGLSSSRRARRQAQQGDLAARLGQVGVALAALLSVILGLTAIAAGFYYSQVSTGLPSIAGLPALLDGPGSDLQQPTRLLAADGETLILSLENPNANPAQYLNITEIPYYLLDAMVAANDPEFWDHNGYTLKNMGPETHPTFAQNLAFDFLLVNESASFSRALRERLLAGQLTAQYGQAKVLEWYLNSADFGQLATGVDAAAWVYFGKSAVEVNLAEAAMLAAINQSPDLNPIDTPDLALEKQSRVLQAMFNQNYLNEADALAANQLPLQVLPAAPDPQSLAPDFSKFALQQTYDELGRERVRRGGLVITTSLDLALQAQVDCLADLQLARLDGSLPLDSLGSPDCTGARLLPALNRDQIGEPVSATANIAVLDPTTGALLALRGDPASLLTPGSSLSPFVYLASFAQGLSPASLLWDIPASLPAPAAGYSNPDGIYLGPLRLREALANDRVVAALHTLAQVGPANAWRTVRQSGLEAFNPPESGSDAYRPLLDSYPISLIELAQAYGLFANNGFLGGRVISESEFSSTGLVRVTTPHNAVLLDWNQPDQRAVTSAQLAYLITDILSDPLARRLTLGTNNPLEVNRPAAAYLAQSSTGLDTWAIGYSPQRVVVVWIGAPAENNPLSPIPAGGLWQAVFRVAHSDLPVVDFVEPLGLTQTVVCVPSGMLPTADCPERVEEIFIPGNEPVHLDTLFQTFLVNSQTGRLATIFTPEEYVEERVYMAVPPEAESWARSAGIDLPPQDYDVVFNPGAATGTVAITSPEIFSTVRGAVPIQGRTVVDGFSYYRIQVGEGLNPRQWLQIGTDNIQQVVNDQLGVWDTSGLNGLYAIQLLVVDANQNIERFSIQVTVDNTPPDVSVLIPLAGQHFTYPQEANITFQAEVSDNLGIARVEFFIDRERIASLSQGPFVSPWNGSLGSHTLTVKATDNAGNIQEMVVDFVIER